jgi:hypothetical protein
MSPELEKQFPKLPPIHDRIDVALAGPDHLDPDVQRELAIISSDILPYMPDEDNYAAVDDLDRAVYALLSKPPKIEAAKALRLSVDSQLWANAPWYIRTLLLGTSNPGTSQITGAIFALLAGIFGIVIIEHWGIIGPVAAWASIAALFGGVVSVVTGLEQAVLSTRSDLHLSFAIGFFRLLIGVGFGTFAYALVAGKVVQIAQLSISAPLGKYVAWTIAFLCGFSDRLGPDLMRQLERRFGTTLDRKPPRPKK